MKKLVVVLGVLLLLGGIALAGFDYWVRALKSSNTANREFIIAGADAQTGRDSIVDVGKNLAQEGLIASKYHFYYYAWRGQLRGKVLAGTYVIPSQSSLAEIAQLFTKGEIKEEKPVEVSLTFKEGLTLEEMALVVEEGNFPHEEFLSMAMSPSSDLYDDHDFLKRGASLEGFLFPDTYNFFPEASAEVIIRKMLANFDKKVSASMRENIQQQGKELFDVIILASIVEGEVTGEIDRGVVAGIFQNRLDIDMPLQTDASIDYIKGIAEIKHTLEDLKIDSPYNTYLYPGLPPGPMNSPSLDSIIAAMSPSETEYFFFLSSNKEGNRGETIFAETFEEHVINKNNNGL